MIKIERNHKLYIKQCPKYVLGSGMDNSCVFGFLLVFFSTLLKIKVQWVELAKLLWWLWMFIMLYISFHIIYSNVVYNSIVEMYCYKNYWKKRIIWIHWIEIQCLKRKVCIKLNSTSYPQRCGLLFFKKKKLFIIFLWVFICSIASI